MEEMANEATRADIKMLRTGDPMMASKFGVTELPNIVYFGSKIPSLYDGEWYPMAHKVDDSMYTLDAK